MSWWATRTAWSHADANCGLATRAATLSRTNSLTAVASVGVRPCIRWASSGRKPWAASASIASFASPWTSTCWKTVVVIRLVSASCTEGSAASGRTVSTNRSVSDTWLWVHTATSDTGTNTQPSTSSTTAMTDRQRMRRRGGRVPARSVEFSRRSRSSSARSSAVSGSTPSGTLARSSAWDMCGLRNRAAMGEHRGSAGRGPSHPVRVRTGLLFQSARRSVRGVCCVRGSPPSGGTGDDDQLGGYPALTGLVERALRR